MPESRVGDGERKSHILFTCLTLPSILQSSGFKRLKIKSRWAGVKFPFCLLINWGLNRSARDMWRCLKRRESVGLGHLPSSANLNSCVIGWKSGRWGLGIYQGFPLWSLPQLFLCIFPLIIKQDQLLYSSRTIKSEIQVLLKGLEKCKPLWCGETKHCFSCNLNMY